MPPLAGARLRADFVAVAYARGLALAGGLYLLGLGAFVLAMSNYLFKIKITNENNKNMKINAIKLKWPLNGIIILKKQCKALTFERP